MPPKPENLHILNASSVIEEDSTVYCELSRVKPYGNATLEMIIGGESRVNSSEIDVTHNLDNKN